MKKIAVIAAVVVIAALSAILYFKSGGSDMMSLLPKPKENEMYLLVDTRDRGCPDELAVLVSEGFSSLLEDGTPCHAIVFASTVAEETAVLAKNIRQDGVNICAAMRFSSSETDKLKEGKLPECLAPLLINARIRKCGGENIFAAEADGLSVPVYYFVRDEITGFAADLDTARLMMQAAEGKTESLKGKSWEVESSWNAHAEYCDGGAITKNAEYKFPITVQAAWRSLEKKAASDPAGEVIWKLVDLDSAVASALSDTFKPEKWDTSKCIVPQPLLLSAGINIPESDSKPDEWVFPLSLVAGTATQMSLTDEEKNKAISGRTVISLGGQSKILWFTLPGFTVELSGEQNLMKSVVESFWKDVFAGADVRPINGFDCGGTANVPFSVVGAAKDNTAIMGLASPETLGEGRVLDACLGKDKEAIGWLYADMPRIGSALADMTKMSSVLDNDFMDNGIDDYGQDEDEDEDETTLSESGSPLDSDAAAETFGELAKRMGKIFIVWEEPTSGKVCWYSTEDKK
ncbi:MAG: hypothetical protein Q4E17_06730 [Synergistes sp.]|nr:hypothetical protein [Synergistes sp.]